MKRLLYLSVVSLGALLWACQADGNMEKSPPLGGEEFAAAVDSGVMSDEGNGTMARAKTGTPVVIDDAVKIEGANLMSADSEGFAMDAFPPMLPSTDFHANAWLRDDCMLCHASGVQGAPLVRHQGMSPALLAANCRTCHLAADPDAGPLTNLAGEELVQFLSNAFPPTLPVDDSHSIAWMRTDCLACHRLGVRNAPKVQHHGMSKLLLKASCRSCHLPGTNSAETDVP